MRASMHMPEYIVFDRCSVPAATGISGAVMHVKVTSLSMSAAPYLNPYRFNF